MKSWESPSNCKAVKACCLGVKHDCRTQQRNLNNGILFQFLCKKTVLVFFFGHAGSSSSGMKQTCKEEGRDQIKGGVLQIDGSHVQRVMMKMSGTLLGLLACLAIASFTSVADGEPL